MELYRRRTKKVQQAFGLFCAVSFVIYIVFINENIREFWDALSYRLSEFDPYLSRDLNDVKLLLWTQKNKYSEVHLNMSSVRDINNLNM